MSLVNSTQAATPPPPLKPAFLTSPSTVETLQQGLKRKRRRIQFVKYLDDDGKHGKQQRKRRHKKKFKPYKYSMDEEED